MGRPPKWRAMLAASKSEAILATRMFNDPLNDRALEGFIVHMHLAWLYLLQAEWAKAGRDYRIQRTDNPRRYVRIDGEYKSRELTWFVNEKYSESDPVRANLDFFIRLRNKVEHRHSGTSETLLLAVSGQCHAQIVNYEKALTELAGNEESLAGILRFPVFVGGFTNYGKDALLELSKSLPAELKRFLADYDASLAEEVSRDPAYSMRLTVVLENGNRKGDLSMQFHNWDELSDEEKSAIDALAARGVVVTRNRKVQVSNVGHLRASEVVAEVAKAIPFAFNMRHFTDAYQRTKARPPNGSPNPSACRPEFCVYDEPHRDYTYTRKFVEHLIKKCSTAQGFEELTGRKPTHLV